MRAEVIAIGDELTSGERLDTNSRWLSRRLVEMGVPVRYHTTVGDDLESCAEVLRRATERAEIVVVTGGLGPTADDLTRDAIAAASGTELQLDQQTVEEIEALFQSRGREMPERNKVQAMFPVGSRKIPNQHGTAPGIEMEVSRPDLPAATSRRCTIFALPGVPAEMTPMWNDTVAARIRELAPATGVIRHRQLKCFGVGESQLEAMLPDIVRRGREPSVGITVHAATITLRVTAHGENAEACAEAMAPTIDTIRECLGTLVFGEEDDELQEAVVRLLLQKQQTLATAECATGGLVAAWLGNIPQAIQVYRGGEVQARDSFGASEQVAKTVKDQARDVRQRFGSDFGLAIGPLPEVHNGPAGTDGKQAEQTGDRVNNDEHFIVALADEQGVEIFEGQTLAHPAIRKELAGKRALDWLRMRLLKQG